MLYFSGALTTGAFMTDGWLAYLCGTLAIVCALVHVDHEIREQRELDKLKSKIHELMMRVR
jgi:hypothetical protein